MTEDSAYGETELGDISLDAPSLERDRDGVASLHDTEEPRARLTLTSPAISATSPS
jgi:hypothetical protein